jgi:hypothetical protein
MAAQRIGIGVLLCGLAACGAPGELGDDVAQSAQALSEGCIAYDGNSCYGNLTVESGGVGYTVRYFRNFALGAPPSNITNAVVVVHGVNRNPWGYFGAALEATRDEGILPQTVVVAPLFAQYFPILPAPNPLCWADNKWPSGAPSTCSAPVSSYEVIDAIVRRLTDRALYPKLTRITFAGHSAGGQLVHRYAMVGKAIQWQATGVTYRYVVANPSSYAYLRPERRDANGAWVIPQSCPSGYDPRSSLLQYDEWNYGLLDRGTGYVGAFQDAWIRGTYPSRGVVYLAGENDVKSIDDDDFLDDNCGALLQGANRRARGLNYQLHLEKYFPSNAHRYQVVPNAGHSVWDMLPSELGRKAMFR